MRKSDYSHVGRKVSRAVREAMRTGNFEDIGRTVEDTVQDFTHEVNDTFGGTQHGNQNRPAHPYAPNEPQSGNPYDGYTYPNADRQEQEAPPRPQPPQPPRPPRAPQYRNPARTRCHSRHTNFGRELVRRSAMPGSVSGTVCSVFGLILGIPLLLADIGLVAALAAYTMTWGEFLPSAVVMFSFTVASFSAAGVGGNLRRRARRFDRYQAALGGAAFGQIQQLAATAGETSERTVKDLKKMIDVGVYPNGHIDAEKTCFMVDDETYQEYLDAEKARLEREKAQHAEEEKKKANPQSEALEAVRREGNEYLLEIRSANDEIPDEQVSGKLYQLENVTGRIFQCVEQHPEKLPDIRKFMRYYLPTTLKLVKSYQEFDKQPAQGENISHAKEEIAHALDTINVAFANLLDSLFADDAFDVSTDISTLETMLKQEGLTGSDFQPKPENHPEPELKL